MKKPASLDLQGFVLAVIIPVLVVLTLVMAVLIYQQLYRTILGGFDAQLRAIGTTTAAFIDGDTHAALVARVDDPDFSPEAMSAERDYLRAVEPMRVIKQRLGITYLYTQVATGEGLDIVYLYDANTDDNHSPPGTTDTLPENDAANIKAVVTEGKIYLTGIEAWEQWGLIKSGLAPIRDATGTPVAMAGADVDITSIRQKTRVALVNVGVAGALALIASATVALVFATRLASVMRRIKLAGFEIAAGKFGTQVKEQGPTELRRLAAAFNGMSLKLRDRLAEVSAANLEAERKRRRQELIRLLAEDRVSASSRAAGIAPPDPLQQPPELTGSVQDDRYSIHWWGTAGADPLRTLAERRALEHLSRRLLAAWGNDPVALWEALGAIAGAGAHLYMLLDTVQGRARFGGGATALVLCADWNGTMAPERPVGPGDEIAVPKSAVLGVILPRTLDDDFARITTPVAPPDLPTGDSIRAATTAMGWILRRSKQLERQANTISFVDRGAASVPTVAPAEAAEEGPVIA